MNPAGSGGGADPHYASQAEGVTVNLSAVVAGVPRDEG